MQNDCLLYCWPKLRFLHIQDCESLKYISPNTLIQSLEYVYIKNCHQLIQVYNMEQNIVLPELGSQESLTNLTFLRLISLSELKYMWNGPNHYLRSVDITECHKLTYLFSEITARTLVHLQFLWIWDCYSLEHLIGEAENMDEIDVSNIKDQSSLFLPKLKVVKIRRCENLKYLCSSQGLPYLESIDIEDCPRLIQIFNTEKNKDGFGLQNCPQLLQVFSSTEERDVIGDHILLNVPFLKNLKVSDCPQISCFIVQAQLIEELVLSNVGNSHQLCNTDVPVLNESCIVVGNHEEVFQVQDGYSFSRIKILELRNLFEVQVIWNDFAQIVTLENLTTLTLSGCNKLRYIFSPMMARSLSHLADLFIEWCEEIERLILTKDQVSSSSSNGDTSLQPMSFPNLTQIVVTNCKNLNSLFPFGFVPVLPKLETLIVTRNSKLEQVFELEDEVEVVAEEEIKFDKLNLLSLEELPGLIHFCHKGYHSVFPAMIELKVRDCPKLTTGFFIDSQEFVHCKTKALQLVEQDAVEESTTV
ncbi:hypothetical protein ES332_D05G432100v1 [Gossypium tomentosum]|uniref:Disease resistance protein At4g27190-like leucine-rich repeats domain-containing protein n=1 Tax=Gossypium tomentosum TaxID=34277 RepID=A0A5D2L6V6_GOSTO|nr:hypothetical protein ES332_D05G432100v1 [Gossypium tomentosum]